MDKNLKEFFDEIVSEINHKDFINEDPVQFPHRYEKLQDIEIAGFLVSLISWGKRSMILRDA